MKLAGILIVILALSCQSVIRYAENPNLAESGGYEDDGDMPPVEQPAGGAIDLARMGRIIAGYLRVPYESGGIDKSGVDCSGLVFAVYRDYNSTRLVNNTVRLYNSLRELDEKQMRYGDLVFFNLDGGGISHVGIYVGHDKFVHASRTEGVIVSSLKDKYYRDALRGIRRVLWEK